MQNNMSQIFGKPYIKHDIFTVHLIFFRGTLAWAANTSEKPVSG